MLAGLQTLHAVNVVASAVDQSNNPVAVTASVVGDQISMGLSGILCVGP